jgi:signal recognition particle receptor subunit alpha
VFAKANGFEVILIDTAGRMQTDANLMKQIANLIAQVKPDLTVFVAEALVGNNGSDQIRQFDKIITDYGGQGAKGLDGIMLTKFDTVDDKVGAALTLVFETGHPIVFLGVGQHYRDLRRMRPDFVVDTLLAGF